MFEPYSTELLWIIIVGFIIAFFLAFGVGANDVANSFGTSVGSKVLTLRQACILATIFEILGAILLGSKVSDTVRKKIYDVTLFENSEKELMLGNLAALTGSAFWNILATFMNLPISGTHSIVGAVLGVALVSRGPSSITWSSLGTIVASWFLSPVLSGLVSALIFVGINRFILRKEKPLEPGLRSLPFFYGFTLLVNVVSIVHDGPELLKFHLIPLWAAFLGAFIIGLIAGLVTWFLVVPWLRTKILDALAKEHDTMISMLRQESKSLQSEESPTKFQDGKALVAQTSLSHPDYISVPMTEPDAKSNEEDPNPNDAEEPIPDDKPEVARIFSFLQILTAVFGSFAHGGNDVSNAIGPMISLWLIYQSGMAVQNVPTPIWLLFYGGLGISVGLWVWGRRVIKTIGEDLSKITPSSGFTIEIGAATTVLLASKIGLPISTTHCKVGSVVFVGLMRQNNKVDWSLFRNIILAWVLTLPVTGLISALVMYIFYATALP